MIKKIYDVQGKNALLKGNIYIPETEIKGIVLIVHGMAEHRKRYNVFCNFLADNGFITYVYDQLGHGETAGSIENLGYMDDKDNLEAMLEDVYIVNKSLQKDFNKENKLKFYLLGHSMGSFISQRYTQVYPDTIDGLILSGSSITKSPLYFFGRLFSKVIVLFKGRKYRSKLLDTLSFGAYNNKIDKPKTSFDWLSVNEENVRNYINDEYCGTIFSASYFYDLMKMFKKINKNFKSINKDLPIYIFGGSDDPVSSMGKGLIRLNKKYLQNGQNDVELMLYNGLRHETLLEENYQEIHKNVLNWLKKHQ